MPSFTMTNMVMVLDKITGKVLVQDRIKSYKGIAFPGGHVEDNESIYDSAIREVKEETGYDIKNLQSCGFIYWNDTNGDKYFTYFYKTTEYSGMPIGETGEGKVFWVKLDDLPNMNLAPNMDKYLQMYSDQKYSECYCSRQDESWKVIYR